MKYILSALLTLSLIACGGSNEEKLESTWYKPDIDTTWQWQLSGDVTCCSLL
jgi:hypothetical protein